MKSTEGQLENLYLFADVRSRCTLVDREGEAEAEAEAADTGTLYSAQSPLHVPEAMQHDRCVIGCRDSVSRGKPSLHRALGLLYQGLDGVVGT